jgi:phenylalanyl-tRNA synthetase beta chain
MKITFDWLSEYIKLDLSPDDLVEALTMLGLEVDSVTRSGWDYNGILVGKVQKKDKHPSADKLSICEVDVGSEILSVVCGAPNVDIGQTVPVATVGTEFPGGFKIKKAKLRGVESNGMICSESELGLSDASDGIMVLQTDTAPGTPFRNVVSTGDVLIDVDVTPNRPDCFGIFGIAREVAAFQSQRFSRPSIDIAESDEKIEALFKVTIKDPEKCPRFTARFIRDVEIAPSPEWLQRRLQAIGVRPINNVVDITNYVMMETGHPLHAYDYDLLQGQEIVVQTLKAGQRFTTLDGNQHELNDECLMICDGERGVGFGGIMGGLNTEVSENTRRVLLECAYFNPVNIRRTSRYLGLSTEASKRFERGVDPNGLLYALNRAAHLIAELSGGKIARGVIDVYPREIAPQKIKLRCERARKLLGVDISNRIIRDLLSSIDFSSSGEAELLVTVPTFRPDVTREIDLIEEIGRLFGYDKVPSVTQATVEQTRPINKSLAAARKIPGILLSAGFSEIVTYDILSRRQVQMFLHDSQPIELVNPLSEDFSTLRPSLIPGLLNTMRRNINYGNRDLRIFETGRVFTLEDNEIQETERIAGGLSGNTGTTSWKNKSSRVDIFDLKGFIQYLFTRCKIENWSFEISNHLLLDHVLDICINGGSVGFAGQVSETLLAKFDVDQPVFVFDLEFNSIKNGIPWERKFKQLQRFPSVKRDIALMVRDQVRADQLLREIRAAGGLNLRDVRVFDVFSGKQVGEGNKSIAFNLMFYSPERTLTEQEIDAAMGGILDRLSGKFSAKLRE